MELIQKCMCIMKGMFWKISGKPDEKKDSENKYSIWNHSFLVQVSKTWTLRECFAHKATDL